MNIVWAHNFDPRVQNAGVFMYTLLRALEERGAKVKELYLGNLRRPSGIPRAISYLRKVTASDDILHAQFGSACGLAVSAVPGRKVLSLRGSDWYRIKGHGPWKDRVHGLLATRMTHMALPRFNRVVVMSDRMRAEVQRYVSPKRVVTIADGIDLEQFKPIERGEARRLLGCGDDLRPWVLFTSIFSDNPIKRPSLARRAVEIARRSIPDLQLRVASGRPHEDMPILVNASSVVLMTSTHEGWPNAIKEALACNIPFVSTDVSDLREIAALEPSCSVEPNVPEALGAALVRAIRAPPSATLCQRVAWMENRIVAERLMSLYAELLEGGRAGG